MFISIHCKFPKVADQLYSKRRTSHLADVVGRVVAAHVVPLVVPGRDRDVVDYNHEHDHDVDNHAWCTPLQKSPYWKNISVHFKRLLREPLEC